MANDTTYKYRTQHLRGTKEEWERAESITRLEGESVIELDKSDSERPYHKLKIGDGVSSYSELSYIMAGDEIVS